jgi:hypothetical protein
MAFEISVAGLHRPGEHDGREHRVLSHAFDGAATPRLVLVAVRRRSGGRARRRARRRGLFRRAPPVSTRRELRANCRAVACSSSTGAEQ